MLQDPNVERYVEQAMKPVLKQIKELKAEVEELKKALRKTDVSCSVPSDVLDLLKTIARSEERIYRERARALLRRYCN